jgi:ring-1,2-phenylacetyl-CoA epoxidase subunit PaaD
VSWGALVTALPAVPLRDLNERLARARAALEAVTDPELPFLTIRDLGILREVRLAGDVLEVVITPTYLGCPAWDVISGDVDVALARAGIGPYRVHRETSPAWTTAWLTVEAREKLRRHGIAPPERASGTRALFSVVPVACPKCGSQDTERVSEFGSTACKAHYRCLACAEPFDYFKCV